MCCSSRGSALAGSSSAAGEKRPPSYNIGGAIVNELATMGAWCAQQTQSLQSGGQVPSGASSSQPCTQSSPTVVSACADGAEQSHAPTMTPRPHVCRLVGSAVTASAPHVSVRNEYNCLAF